LIIAREGIFSAVWLTFEGTFQMFIKILSRR